MNLIQLNNIKIKNIIQRIWHNVLGGQFWSCEHNQFNDVGRRMVAKNPKKIWREWNSGQNAGDADTMGVSGVVLWCLALKWL